MNLKSAAAEMNNRDRLYRSSFAPPEFKILSLFWFLISSFHLS
jgi:hypothetical protein